MWEDWLTPKPPRRWRGGKNQCIAHLGSLRKQETEGTAQKGRLKKERRVNRRRDRGRAAFAGSAECLAGQGRPDRSGYRAGFADTHLAQYRYDRWLPPTR